jgi:hypothetical protein
MTDTASTAGLGAGLDLPHPAGDDRSARAASLRSRACVQAGDRAGWVALFVEDGLVQDPVGPSALDPSGDGHRGHEAIGTFFDTYIAPNEVRMTVHRSDAGGDEVCNVLTIDMTLADGSSTSVPATALYKVDAEGKILTLRAFWEMEKLTFTPAPG